MLEDAIRLRNPVPNNPRLYGIMLAFTTADATYSVEFQRAPDVSGAPGTYVTVQILKPTASGAGMFVDQLSLGTGPYWYQARQTRSDLSAGPWTTLAASLNPMLLDAAIGRPVDVSYIASSTRMGAATVGPTAAQVTLTAGVQALQNNFIGGGTLFSTTAPTSSTATISVIKHDVTYADKTVTYNAGTVTGLAASIPYYVYCDDPQRLGGSVTYYASQLPLPIVQGTGRYYVGYITTPAVGGSGTGGTGSGSGSGGGGKGLH